MYAYTFIHTCTYVAFFSHTSHFRFMWPNVHFVLSIQALSRIFHIYILVIAPSFQHTYSLSVFHSSTFSFPLSQREHTVISLLLRTCQLYQTSHIEGTFLSLFLSYFYFYYYLSSFPSLGLSVHLRKFNFLLQAPLSL